MQHGIRTRLTRTLRRAGALAALACLAGAGAAQADCPGSQTSQPFSQFGDLADYELAPQGSFENGADGWDLSGADTAAGNEDYFVGSPSDATSLQVHPGGVAVSSSLCVDARYPMWRLFAKGPARKGELKIEMLYTDPSGKTKVAPAAKLANGKGEYADWRPTQQLKLARALPVSKSPTGTLSIRLRFTADKAGDWAVDDIYLDPYRS
jgi:hypothetical protein